MRPLSLPPGEGSLRGPQARYFLEFEGDVALIELAFELDGFTAHGRAQGLPLAAFEAVEDFPAFVETAYAIVAHITLIGDIPLPCQVTGAKKTVFLANLWPSVFLARRVGLFPAAEGAKTGWFTEEDEELRPYRVEL
ncbi:MAG: hypothetical protein WCP06_09830 [Verrucomicrobiota bacterium]